MQKTLTEEMTFLPVFSATFLQPSRHVFTSSDIKNINRYRLTQQSLLQTVFNYFNMMRGYNFLPTSAYDEEPARCRKHSHLSQINTHCFSITFLEIFANYHIFSD